MKTIKFENLKVDDVVKVKEGNMWVQGTVDRVVMEDRKIIVTLPLHYTVALKHVTVVKDFEDVRPVFKDFNDWKKFNEK